jgi:hypothetical protein
VRKIYVNPVVDGLSEEVKKIIELIEEQQAKLQQAQKIS